MVSMKGTRVACQRHGTAEPVNQNGGRGCSNRAGKGALPQSKAKREREREPAGRKTQGEAAAALGSTLQSSAFLPGPPHARIPGSSLWFCVETSGTFNLGGCCDLSYEGTIDGQNRMHSPGMMFVTFALTFLTLKDEDRSSGYAFRL